MIKINSWMNKFNNKLHAAFNDNLLFVGLQGSYKRGEANENSDIDVVVIFEKITIHSLKLYKEILDSMPEAENACGFVGDRELLLNWPRHELFQFTSDARPIFGKLEPLLPEINQEDIIQSVKISASGLYHDSCHAYLHDENYFLTLKGLFKSAFFLLQAIHYLRSGKYIGTKKELLPLLTGREWEILAINMNWDEMTGQIKAYPEDFIQMIIEWSRDVLLGNVKDRKVTKESLFKVLDILDESGISYWVDGGWGVDILLGAQTREHRDIDINFDGEFTQAMLSKLINSGYEVTTDWMPTRVELYHPEHGFIDIHPLTIEKSGDAKQAAPDGGWYDFKAEWFITSAFENRVIPCLSLEAQLLFHSGYELREVDKADIEHLNGLLNNKK